MTPAEDTTETTPTRDRLVAATLAELDESGYGSLRVDEVARRAGLTSGAIYATFPTKQDLILAALRSRDAAAVDRALARLRDGAEAVDATPDPVLVAAREVLDDRGYRRARVADVARQAGVTSAAVRVDHPTKHDLLVAAIVAESPAEFATAAARDDPGPDAGTDPSASTEDRLLAATLEVLDESGYRDATVAAIARRAGLTTGAIYANFGSKHALFGAAMAQRYESLFRESTDHGGDPMSALVSAVSDAASADHRALIEVIAVATRDDSVRDALAERIARRGEVIAATIDARKADGSMSPDVATAPLVYLVQLLGLGAVVGGTVGLEAPGRADLQAVFALLADVAGPSGSG